MHITSFTLSLFIVCFVLYLRHHFQTNTVGEKGLFLLFLKCVCWVDGHALCGEFMIVHRFAKALQIMHLKMYFSLSVER